ncbi:MAG: NAD(P)-dependent oxidoreductase [Cyclobacteriaceae bacterium]
MKILITGANGLLGQKLIEHYEVDPMIEVIATGKGGNRNREGSYKYLSLDITSEAEVNSVIETSLPDVVINTAAMTNVDTCEMEKEACWDLNVNAVQYLIKACETSGSKLIHLSTDFIFDGENGPYEEDDWTNPQSQYAQSKLASEELFKKTYIKWAIVRTMLVYGIAQDMNRSNIILWTKQNLEEGKQISVVNDQWRTPTLAEDLAKGCALVIEKKAEGIFHISGKDTLTPYDMAIQTAAFFKLNPSLIQEVDGTIFSQPAKRPQRTGFILDKAKRQLGYEPHSFAEGLEILRSQIGDA